MGSYIAVSFHESEENVYRIYIASFCGNVVEGWLSNGEAPGSIPVSNMWIFMIFTNPCYMDIVIFTFTKLFGVEEAKFA